MLRMPYTSKRAIAFGLGTFKEVPWKDPELCDKRWFGFEIEYLPMARFFQIQYQNQ